MRSRRSRVADEGFEDAYGSLGYYPDLLERLDCREPVPLVQKEDLKGEPEIHLGPRRLGFGECEPQEWCVAYGGPLKDGDVRVGADPLIEGRQIPTKDACSCNRWESVLVHVVQMAEQAE